MWSYEGFQVGGERMAGPIKDPPPFLSPQYYSAVVIRGVSGWEGGWIGIPWCQEMPASVLFFQYSESSIPNFYLFFLNMKGYFANILFVRMFPRFSNAIGTAVGWIDLLSCLNCFLSNSNIIQRYCRNITLHSGGFLYTDKTFPRG